MPRGQTNAHFQHPNNAAFRGQLREAIKARKTEKKEMKVGKPIDLQLTAECECAICLETLSANNISVTPCGHKFCFTCLAENMRRSQKCPMCRAPLAKRAPGKEMTDEKFSEIHFEDTDYIYAKLRRITKGLNQIYNEHAFIMEHSNLATQELIFKNDNDEEIGDEVPEHLQSLGGYAEAEDENVIDEHETMYEFNQQFHEHPTVGGLRLPARDDRSSAPSPESREESDSDSDESNESDESDDDEDESVDEDIADDVINDLETDDGKPMGIYEKLIMRLILDSRAGGMATACDWYEDGSGANE